MKLYKTILLLLIFFLLNLNVSSADEGDEFNNIIMNIGDYNFSYIESRNDIGVFYEFSWDSKKRIIQIKRDTNNYPIVRFSLFDKKNILPGTIIKKYNDIDLSKLSDLQIKKLHKKNNSVKLELLNGSKIKIDNKNYKLNDFKLSNFILESINNIDSTRGILEISFNAEFTNDRPELNVIAKNLLQDLKYPVSYDLINSGFSVPIESVEMKEYKWDVDIRNGIKNDKIAGIPWADFTFDNGEVRIARNESGIGQFRQKFNFENFPFDIQKLIININSGVRSTSNPNLSITRNDAAVTFITPEPGAFIGLDNFSKNNYLREWSVISTNIKSKEIILHDYYDQWLKKVITDNRNSIDLIIEIKRNSTHYLYKIIVPVFLILCVAWSVLWIPTHKLDARLTTSIVALLALIAYNFVFENDIPKLEYLTDLDKYVLLSYVFCCIPTFISVGFSRFILKTKKKQAMVTKINSHIRRWGGLIYLFTTFQIFYN